MTTGITTDYLVVGAGATAMTFVDTLLTETDRTVTIVDRRDQPGGHWNDAYPFVRMHGPSWAYGVASRPLGRDAIDTEGFNAGLPTLASRHEVLDHFDQALRRTFLPSGRVIWLPRHDYAATPAGGHRLRSLLDGSVRDVTVGRRLVDATRWNTRIPATHPPRYDVSPGVALIPPGGLVGIGCAPARYCVVGAGKTAMDACVWLIERGVDPSRIRWVKSRDPWISDRRHMRDAGTITAFFVGVLRCLAEAASVPDFWARAEACGVVSRVDPGVRPTAYRCATLSERELAMLRRIGDVVRLGRVRAIEPARLVLQRGAAAAEPDTLYVDCTATAWNEPAPTPVFEPGRINLQQIQYCAAPISIALTAFVEARYDDDAEKNAVCGPVPLPNVPSDLFRMVGLSLANEAAWQKRPEIGAWKSRCRLDAAANPGRPGQDADGPSPDQIASLSEAAAARLPALLAEAEAGEPRA